MEANNKEFENNYLKLFSDHTCRVTMVVICIYGIIVFAVV